MNVSSILIAIDLNNSNEEVLKFSFKIAERLGAKLTFSNCYHPRLRKGQLTHTKESRLEDLESAVAEVAVSSEIRDYNCVVIEALAGDAILVQLNSGIYDLLIIGSHPSSSIVSFKSIAANLIEQTSIQTIVLPAHFKMIDLSHVVFNLEFEFREIYKIFELLDFCASFSAFLSCVHFCTEKQRYEAEDNLKTYNMLYESYSKEKLSFELVVSDKLKGLNHYAKECEADMVVMFKSRKTWKNQYLAPAEEKLMQIVDIPMLITDNHPR